MKTIYCLIALLGACSAQTAPETSNNEGVDSQALVAPGASRSCATLRCLPGYVCEENCGQPGCVPIVKKPECTQDSDCRLFSDYCEGCNCLALGPAEPAPKCTGNTVQCFVDPCRNLAARCEYGSCVAGNGELQ